MRLIQRGGARIATAQVLTLEDAIHRALGEEAAHAKVDDPDSWLHRFCVNQDIFQL